MTIGDRVKLLRQKKKMTQLELAEKLGYKSKSSVAHIENGRDIPRSMVVTLADILETTPSYLMGWEDEKLEHETQTNDTNDVQLEHTYLSFAKEAQDEGLDPEDIRLAIETIKAMKNKNK